MLKRTLTALADLTMINRRLVTSSAFRASVLTAYGRLGLRPELAKLHARERAAVSPAASVHAALSDAAVTLAGAQLKDNAPATLNLVLSELRPNSVFAGVSTALDAAHGLATRLNLPLRVIMLSANLAEHHATAASNYLRERFGTETHVIDRRNIPHQLFSSADVWIATHWTTAHALQVATIADVIDRSRVVYLIQDYEPGFNAWSTEHNVARGTYHAGFIPLVNSLPLAEYLRQEDQLEVEQSSVFGPSFDTTLLERVAHLRRPGTVRVLFYARPSKPRNLYALGVAALKDAVLRLGDGAEDIEIVSAGERHAPVDLGGGKIMHGQGTLDWESYFALLSSAPVVLSLQGSPHPSHPPLEAAMTGARAVTNEFAGTRGDLHERLTAVDAHPAALGAAVAQSIRAARSDGPGRFDPIPTAKLGGPLAEALDAVAGRIAP
jgi:O-antigen biosynthesis protein